MKNMVFETMLDVEIPRYIRKQVPIAVCINLGQVIVGYGLSWSSPVIPKLKDPGSTPLDHTITDHEASWIGSFIYVGCLATFTVGYLANKIGRRICLMIAAVLNILSYCLMTWPLHIAMIYTGRAISGFSLSIITVVSLVYIGEIASPNIRGIVLTSTGVFISLGMLLLYSVGPFVSYAIIGYLMIALNILYLLGILYIPESPVFYVLKDKEIEARSTLEKLARTGDIDTELQTMISTAEEYRNNYINYPEVFTIKSNRVALIITSVLCFIQQCNGVVVVMFFTMTILKKSQSLVNPTIGTIILGVIILLGALFASSFVDKYGRRFLLVISTSFCCLAMATLGTYFYLVHHNHHYVDYLRWVPVTTLCISLFSFHIGLGIIPHTLTGEMYRPNVRGAGTATTMSIGYLAGFLSTSSFSYIVLHVGNYVCFWTFSAVNLFALVFTVCFVPETKGRSLTEIEAVLGGY